MVVQLRSRSERFTNFGASSLGNAERGGDAEFIAVEDAAAVSSRLPFIVGVKLHAEAFAAAEEVAVGDSQDQTHPR